MKVEGRMQGVNVWADERGSGAWGRLRGFLSGEGWDRMLLNVGGGGKAF